jgi:hypothetical protein
MTEEQFDQVFSVNVKAPYSLKCKSIGTYEPI